MPRGLVFGGQSSDTAGKALAIIGEGVKGLEALNTFVAPSAQAIDNFAYAVHYVLLRLGELAATLSTEGLATTTLFANAAQAALTMVKTGVDAFKAMANLSVPSAKAIDDVLAAIQYVVLQTGKIADAIGVEGLAKATAFATGADKVFTTMKNSLDLLTKLRERKDDPFRALDDLRTGMAAALSVASDMVAQADQMLAKSRDYLRKMQEAAANFAAGLALGQGIGNTGSLATAAGSGATSAKGGNTYVTVQAAGSIMAERDLQESVVAAVETAKGQGRL